MDYETADGSQFSLREIFTDDYGARKFQETLITAFVDGNAYSGKSPLRMEDMDEVEVLEYLQPVPPENVFPLAPDDLTVAPPFDKTKHYLKAPQFTYGDSLPGRTFVADVLLNEARVLERLRRKPHVSIVPYHGVVVKDSRITHLCLQRCHSSLLEYYESGLPTLERNRLLDEVIEGIEHLHTMGLAHNDINLENICVDATGHAVIVDFDSCLPFGEPLMKGAMSRDSSDKELPTSRRENDLEGLRLISHFLCPQTNPDVSPDDG